jgi:hypothetical protein
VAVRAAQEIERGLGNVRRLDCGVHADPRDASRHATGRVRASGRQRREATVARAQSGRRAD